MKNLTISGDVERKLQEKHNVVRSEVEQCFYNRAGRLLIDSREDHKTTPPTLWFLAPTNKGRMLKIVYIQVDTRIHLRSAFEPNEAEEHIYRKYGQAC